MGACAMYTPQPGDTLEILVKDPDFVCAYRGQTALVTRPLDEGRVYSVLHCGHIYLFDPSEANITFKVTNRDISSELLAKAKESFAPGAAATGALGLPIPGVGIGVKESPMAKKQYVIPNANQTIHIQGHEAEVEALKLNHDYLKNLEGQVSTQKVTFRKLAANAAKQAEGGVQRVEFLSKSGALVAVSLPDYHDKSSRTVVSDKALKAAAKLGFDAADMDITEQVESYTLTGDFVAVMDAIIAREYTSKGLKIPEGIKKTSSRKLSLEGFQKLEGMAASAKTDQEREVAELLLDAGLKAPTVNVE